MTRPDAVALAEAAATWRGAYVHIPFCARLCPYCDFAVVPGQLDQMDRYIEAVVREVGMEPEWAPLDTVFFGGGTPSRVPADRLARVCDALSNRFGFASDVEVTIEANPEDVDAAYARQVAAAGIARVSLGAQSFDDGVLAALGRVHRAVDTVRAVDALRSAGIASISIDLIFGHPVETAAVWSATLDEAVAAGVDHVSTYALTVERGTELSRQIADGAPAPDEDTQADRWSLADARLAQAGFIRYEVSNRAKVGHVSRHNLATWGRAEYVAFGLGAHGFRAGVRRRNVRRLDAYLEAIEANRRPEAGRETVAGWQAECERVMLGLRRAAGVRAGRAGTALLASDEGRRLTGAGVLVRRGDRLVVERPLLTDAAVRAVLWLPES